MTPEAGRHRAADLRVGMSAEFERDVAEEDVLDFARNSGDHNPLHVDRDYALHSNYGHRIVHGAFQVGMASAMLGMHLPGRNALLTLLNAQFPAPLRFPTRVRVRGEIVAWNPVTGGGRLRVTVSELPGGTTTADIGVGFALHEELQQRPQQQPLALESAQLQDRPLALVTGASGGIGSQVVRALLESYRVLAVYNRTPLPDGMAPGSQLQPVKIDFSDSNWPNSAAEALQARPLFAAIHCAWPGMPHGGLLQLPADAIRTQLTYGTTHLIELARLLTSHADPSGGRLIAIGSVAGSQRPNAHLAAYSLAKAAMEHTVRLLAAELAVKRITVNAICPSFVPAGMNQHADERRRKLEAAQVPLGRLCQPEDIAGMIRWLVSPGASFVSGQVLGLTGAQL